MPGRRFEYEYLAQFTKAADGSTLEFVLDLGFDTHTNMRFRLDKVDVWGIKSGPHQKMGIDAKYFVEHELTEAEQIVVFSCRHENGVYFADVFYKKPGDKKWRNLSKALIKRELGTPKSARKKPTKTKELKKRVRDAS